MGGKGAQRWDVYWTRKKKKTKQIRKSYNGKKKKIQEISIKKERTWKLEKNKHKKMKRMGQRTMEKNGKREELANT